MQDSSFLCSARTSVLLFRVRALPLDCLYVFAKTELQSPTKNEKSQSTELRSVPYDDWISATSPLLWIIHTVHVVVWFNLLCTPSQIVKLLIDQFFILPSDHEDQIVFLYVLAVMFFGTINSLQSDMNSYITYFICCVDAICKNN